MNEVSKPRDVDEYIANSAAEARPKLDELRAIVRATVPQAEEGISWSVPFYRYHGALAGFAVYKNHVSFGLGAGLLQSSDRKLLEDKGYATGKRTIQIRFDQSVPATVIRRILKEQAEMNEAARSD
jgi:uncharacterized protein YdhG (YjbR/CyaY superfamily)